MCSLLRLDKKGRHLKGSWYINFFLHILELVGDVN